LRFQSQICVREIFSHRACTFFRIELIEGF
jgi:hypothetical protein